MARIFGWEENIRRISKEIEAVGSDYIAWQTIVFNMWGMVEHDRQEIKLYISVWRMV